MIKIAESFQEQARIISDHVVEDSPDPMIAVNGEGAVLIFNNAAANLFGYKKEEVIGIHVTRLYESEPEARRVGGLLLSAPGNVLENEEVRVMAKDGTIIPVSLSGRLYLDDRKRKIGSFSVFKDVRSMKRPYEEEARAKYFRDLVLNSPDPTIVIDKEGHIEIFNNAAAELFNYDPQQAIGEPITMLYTSRKEASRIGHLLSTRPGNKVQNLETRTVGSRGETIPVSLSARWLKDEKNEFSGSLGVFKDLREIKSDVFARIARTTVHATKNSLQAALMNLDALNHPYLRKADKDTLIDITGNINEAINGIRNLLLTGSPPRMAWTSADLILRELLKRFGKPTSALGISFEGSLEGNDFEVLVDFNQIFQVISNLFVNSVDAILEKTAYEDIGFSGQIEIELRESYGNFVLTWKDNGTGIAEEDRDKVFDLFFTNKGRYSGNGVGLFISKNIIERHGGRITVRSQERRFTEFTIEIPRQDEQKNG